jgi:predicted O-methyltransferase YrrM
MRVLIGADGRRDPEDPEDPDPVPRYGYGRPSHAELYEIIAGRREEYRALLDSFAAHEQDLVAIPLSPTGPGEPSWTNGWFQALDAVALYCLMADSNPRRYVEVGSGNSTMFARRAVSDHRLQTEIVSIDPEPRADIDDLCDRVVRSRLEDTDLTLFGGVEAGDIVFIDSSHRCLQNNDTTTFFLDVLPRLPAGVLVQVHDIFLPWDYPPQWADRRYSEQYLLASWLLSAPASATIVLPCFFVSIEPDLHHVLDWLWDRFVWSATAANGQSFWFRTTDPCTPSGP